MKLNQTFPQEPVSPGVSPGMRRTSTLKKKKTLQKLEVPSNDDSKIMHESTQSHNQRQESQAGPNKAVKSFIELLNLGATDSFAEDVTSKLPILQQIEQEWNSNEVVQTPYDCNSLIQTFCNPLDPEQHITVRLVTENVRRNTKQAMQDLEEEEENRPLSMACKHCNKRLQRKKFRSQISNFKCQQCFDPIQEDHYYFQCTHCVFRQQTLAYCIRCVASFNSAKVINAKTVMHGFYDEFEPQSQQSSAEQDSVQEDFEDYMYGFQPVIPNKHQAELSKTIAKISFWKIERVSQSTLDEEMGSARRIQLRRYNNVQQPQVPQEQVFCYFEHKVSWPLCFPKVLGSEKREASEPLNLQDHVFMSECRTKIFYFSFKNDEKKHIILNIIHLKTLKSENIQIDGPAVENLKNFFKGDSGLSQPRLLGDSQFLCISSIEDTTNLLFFYNTQTWELHFSIQQAWSLIHDTEQKRGVVPDSVWILQDGLLAKYLWPKRAEEKPKLITSYDFQDFKRKLQASKRKPKAVDSRSQSQVEKAHRMNFHEIEGYIHKDQTRCTLIIKAYNWYSYELTSGMKKNSRKISFEDSGGDAVFVFNPKDQTELKLALNRQSVTRENSFIEVTNKRFEDYYFMFVLDLNSDEMPISTRRDKSKMNFAFTSQHYTEQLYFKLSEEFKDAYVYLNFSNFYKKSHQYYSSQAIYVDVLKGMNHMFFLSAKLKKDNGVVTQTKAKKLLEEHELQEIVNWELPKMRKIVNYPILAYTTSDPNHKELMICNLSKNQPQKKLKFDFKILCFCEVSQKLQEKYSPDENLIFFLALNPDFQVELYLLRCRVWDTMEDELVLSKFKMKLNLKHYEIDKIKNAQVLRILREEELEFVVLIQFPEHIIAVSDFVTQQMTQSDVDLAHMAQVYMFSGILDRCYYIQRSKHEGDELMCIMVSNTGKLESICIFKQKEKIIQVQIDQSRSPPIFDSSINVNGGRFFVFDYTYQIKVLEYENQRRQLTDPVLVQTHCINLQDYSCKRVVRALEQLTWSKAIVNSKAIISARVHLIDSLGDNFKIQRKAQIHSTECQSYHAAPMFQGIGKDTDLECLDIEQINSIGKIMQEVKSGQSCYFQTMQNPTIKRVDLLNFVHQNHHATTHIVLKSLILVVFRNNKYLVFDQNSMMLLQIGDDDLTIMQNVQGDDLLILKNDQTFCKFNDDGTLEELYDKNDLETLPNDDFMECLNFPEEGKGSGDEMCEHYCMTSFHKDKAIILKQLVDFRNLEDDTEMVIFSDQDRKSIQLAMVWTETTIKLHNSDGPREKGEVEQIYFRISGAHFKFGEDSQVDFLRTDRHIILRTLNIVWFINFKDVQKVETYEEIVHLQYFQMERNQPMKFIWLTDMFQGIETFLSGVKIHLVDLENLSVVCNAEKVEVNGQKQYKNVDWDVIQMTFLDLAIMWSLEENCEIFLLQRPSVFAQIDTYTTTGFRYCADFDYDDDGEHIVPQHESSYLHTNAARSLISAPHSRTSLSVVFRQYSNLELQQIMFIEDILNQSKNKSIKFSLVHSGLLTVNIMGETFFSRFCHDVRLLNYAIKIINDLGLEKDEDQVEDKIELRMIFFNLALPFYFKEESAKNQKESESGMNCLTCFDSKKKQSGSKAFFGQTIKRGMSFRELKKERKVNKHNLVQWMVKEDKPEIEKILKILLMSSEVGLSLLVQNFKQFKAVFQIQHDLIGDFMTQALAESPHCAGLTNMYWEDGQSIVCFTAMTGCYCTKKIQAKTKNALQWRKGSLTKLRDNFMDLLFKEKEMHKLCKVKIVEISWLNGKISQFYKYLSAQADSNSQIFDNDLVKILLQEQNYTVEIFTKIFLPYIVYMILLLVYFMNFIPLNQEANGFFDTDNLTQTINRVLSTFLSMFLFNFEYQQVKFLGMEYWEDIWNYINILQLVINQYIVLEHSTKFTGIQENTLVALSSFACILLALLFFYWMRLSSSMAFYVKMIMETIFDLKQFIIFFCLIITTFSCAFYILDQFKENQYKETAFDYDNAMKKQTSSSLTDAWMNQYLLGLGDFYYLPFSNSDFKDIEWIYFTMATFFTQVVFLNMLIAIMGDTFDRLTEKKSRNGLMQQTALYSDFMIFLKKNEFLNKHKYMYIVTPVNSADLYENTEVWEGGYGKIKDRIGALEARFFEAQRKRQKEENSIYKYMQSKMDELRDYQREVITLLNVQQAISKKEREGKVLDARGFTIQSPMPKFAQFAQDGSMNNVLNIPMAGRLKALANNRPPPVPQIQLDPAIGMQNFHYSNQVVGSPISESPLLGMPSQSPSSPYLQEHLQRLQDSNSQARINSEAQEEESDVDQLRDRIASLDQQMNIRMSDMQIKREAQDKKIGQIQERVQRIITPTSSQQQVFTPTGQQRPQVQQRLIISPLERKEDDN